MLGNEIHVMTNIETLGLGDNATIIQICAIAFDIKTGRHMWVFNEVSYIDEEEKAVVDDGNLKWWLSTDTEWFKKILVREGTMSSEELIEKFRDWLLVISDYEPANLFLWGNGILFDNAKLKLQMEALGLRYPVHYKNDRDVRTILYLTGEKTGLSEEELRNEVKSYDIKRHNAFDDAVYQTRLVSHCYNGLVNKGSGWF